MEYAEDDYLMISGIQHFKFCRRQWALIHVEQQWAENEHTVIGELMHKKAHDPYLTEKRKDLLVVRALAGQFQNDGSQRRMRYCRISEMRRWSETARTQGILQYLSGRV